MREFKVGWMILMALMGCVLLVAIDRWMDPKCHVEAMDQRATVIVKLERRQPCDPVSMAIEARAAVKAALEAE